MKLILVTIFLFSAACRKSEYAGPRSDSGGSLEPATTTTKKEENSSVPPIFSVLEVFHTGREEDSVKLKHGELIFAGNNTRDGLKQLAGIVNHTQYVAVYYDGNLPLPLEGEILSEINSNRDKNKLKTIFVNIFDMVDPFRPLECSVLFELNDGKGFILGGRVFGSCADLLEYVKRSNLQQLAISADDYDLNSKIITDLKSLVDCLVLGTSDPQFPVQTFHDPGFVLPK